MRVWALASCGGLFVLTTYTAFRHDAKAHKLNGDTLLGSYETDQDDQSIPAVTHLQTVSQPQAQEYPSSFASTSTTTPSQTDYASSSQSQTNQALTSAPRWYQSGQPTQPQPLSPAAVSVSSSELSTFQAHHPQSAEASVQASATTQTPTSQNQAGVSASTTATSDTSVNTSPANSETANLSGETTSGGTQVTVTVEPTSVDLSSDVVRPVAATAIAAPSTGLSQAPQFSSDRPASSNQPTANSTLAPTPSLDIRRFPHKLDVQKPLGQTFYPRLSSQRNLTTQPVALTPMTEGWAMSMPINLQKIDTLSA